MSSFQLINPIAFFRKVSQGDESLLIEALKLPLKCIFNLPNSIGKGLSIWLAFSLDLAATDFHQIGYK